MTRPSMSIAEVEALPAVTSLETAGRALGIGRTKAYQLARDGKFPVPVIRSGRTWLVPSAGLRTLLGLSEPGPSRDRPRDGGRDDDA